LVSGEEMGARRFKYTKTKHGEPDEYWVSKSDFKEFDSSFLGLGDISRQERSTDALAAIFDLQGFTSFCDQRDAHLEVPRFVVSFISWLFESISKGAVKEKKGNQLIQDNQLALWYELPFFAKFLGDGVLLLWDADTLSSEAKWDIVSSIIVICNDYRAEFLPDNSGEFTKPPPSLRCGIARGQITAIGDEKDFVGLCINVASRLQKLEGVSEKVRFSFAFTKKGFPLQAFDESWREQFRLIKIPIRGVEKEELVYVLKDEYNLLTEDDQKRFGS
jgi:class 3 adenylate cyclase